MNFPCVTRPPGAAYRHSRSVNATGFWGCDRCLISVLSTQHFRAPSVLYLQLLISWAWLLFGSFGHRLRCVRRMPRNATGRETDNDDRRYNESWYKAHQHDSPVLTVTFHPPTQETTAVKPWSSTSDASRIPRQCDVLKRTHGTLLP
jgi:hypothetical protein